jgi:hypothetical protein
MNILWAALVIVVVAAVTVGAMLLVRRRAPEGSYFEDGDRAAGVFGVLATGFAVLLGFVVFLAFESFDTSRSGAEAEAQLVVQQFETIQFLPATVRPQLGGELVCYARAVVHQEWPLMNQGGLDAEINPWGIAMFRTVQTIDPKTAAEQTAYDKWFDQRSERENARTDRTHGAEGVIPTALWIVLFLTAGVIFVFMLFMADSAERWYVQATMMASVAVVITSTMLLLWFLDNPYHSGVSGLRPVAMERTLRILDQGRNVVGLREANVPCDERGVARG